MSFLVNTFYWIKNIHLHCFTSDSKVSTPNGDKVISEIKSATKFSASTRRIKKVVAKVPEVRLIVDVLNIFFVEGIAAEGYSLD